MKPPAICPVCAWPVPPSARACPGCGSDDATGWSRAPDATFAHMLPEEPIPRRRRGARYGLALIVSVVIVALLAAFGVLHGVTLMVVFAATFLVCCAPMALGKPDPRPEEDRFEILVARCRHDRELAERLVDGERGRRPDAARAIWIERAIERLADDRR